MQSIIGETLWHVRHPSDILGTAIAIARYQTGCNKVLLERCVDEDLKYEWFDEFELVDEQNAHPDVASAMNAGKFAVEFVTGQSLDGVDPADVTVTLHCLNEKILVVRLLDLLNKPQIAGCGFNGLSLTAEHQQRFGVTQPAPGGPAPTPPIG